MTDLGPAPPEQSYRGFLPLLLLTALRAGRGGWVAGNVGGPLGSEVMIGNDGVEDTLDNNGVANSPDD